MILTKQLDVASGSSVTTPRINLVKELEKYNRAHQEMTKKANETETKPVTTSSAEPVTEEKQATPAPVRSVSRPNILRGRQRYRPQQRSASLDSASSASLSTTTTTSSVSATKLTTQSVAAITSRISSLVEKNQNVVKLKPEILRSGPELRFFKGGGDSVCADAVLTIPNPSFLGGSKSSESSSVSNVVSSSEPINTSASSSVSVNTSVNENKMTSQVAVMKAPMVQSQNPQNVSDSNNTMIVGNVFKSSVVTDPTTLPVLMPVATNKAFPASPDDVVLPAGKGYVVFKPMGNLPKDCVYSIESSTGLINAVVDPKKFIKPSVSTPKTFPSSKASYPDSSKPVMSVNQNQNIQSLNQAAKVIKKPVLNPEVQAMLKKHVTATDSKNESGIKQESNAKIDTISLPVSYYSSFLSQLPKTSTVVNEPTKNPESQETTNSGNVVVGTTVTPSEVSLQGEKVPVKILGFNAPPYTSTSSSRFPAIVTLPAVIYSSKSDTSSTTSVSLKKIITDPTENLVQELNTRNELLQRTRAVKFSTNLSTDGVVSASSGVDTSALVNDVGLIPTVVPTILGPDISHVASQTGTFPSSVSVSKTMIYKVFPGKQSVFLGNEQPEINSSV